MQIETFSPESNPNKKIFNQLEKFSSSKILWILFVALVALSFAAIFIRLSEVELSPNATVFNRLWIASIVFGAWNAIKQLQRNRTEKLDSLSANINDSVTQKNNQNKVQTYLGPMLLMGVVSSISIILWAWSLTQTSVANSTVLRNLTPVLTTFLGWLFLGQRFNATFLIGMAIALVGSIAIGLTDFSYTTNHVLGDIAAFLAAFFYSIYLLTVERLRASLSSTTILFWRCFIGAIITLPIVLLTKSQVFPHSLLVWFAVIALAVICQGLGQGLLAYCLSQLSSSFVATTLLLEPIITSFMAWLIFAEQLPLVNWVAFCVVLVGVYLAKSQSPSPTQSLQPTQTKLEITEQK